MRNLVCIALAVAMFIGLGSTSQASIFYDNLTLDNQDDLLSDSSLGYIVGNGLYDENGAPARLLAAGDSIRGVIKIDDVNGVNGMNKVYAVYDFEVVTATASQITFTNGDALSLLSGHSLDTSNLNSTSGLKSVVVVEALGAATSTDFSTIAQVGGEILKSSGSSTKAFDQWTVQLLAGIGTSPDSYTLSRNSTFTGALNDLNDLNGASFTQKIADITGGLSVSGWDNTYVGSWNPVNGGNGSQIYIDTGFVLGANATQKGNGWAFRDTGDFYVNPVPEPSTIAIWAALGLGGCGFVARRRMKAKKA